MTTPTTTNIRRWLERIQADPDTARKELVFLAYRRVRLLTAKILNADFWRLHGRTDEAVDASMDRLLQALEKVTPNDPRHFFRIAAQHIRFALLDIVRLEDRDGPLGRVRMNGAESSDSNPRVEPEARGPGPATEVQHAERLSHLQELVKLVEELPAEVREVVEYLVLMGHPQWETAELLGVPITTVQYRWRTAKAMLAVRARQQLPDLFDDA